MIRYKVVVHGGYSAFIDCVGYKLFYKDGEIVEAPKDTLGIMVFDVLENAISFVDKYIQRYQYPEIKKVETLDEEIIPEFISGRISTYSLYKFYNEKDYKHRFFVEPPKGTICCNKIKVIKTAISY